LQKIFNIIAKFFGTLLLVVLTTGLLAYYAVQLPAVQTTLAQKATEWLSEKLHAQVSIGSVRLNWYNDITLEDVSIQDLKGRPMISVPELYVNFKTNFSFDRKKYIAFDNNLDYVMANRPNVRLIREKDGLFNFDHWVEKIEQLSDEKKQKNKKENNTPFTIDEAYIQNGTFTMVDSRKARFPKNEFDYRNFTLEDIHGKFKNFFIQGDTITSNITELRTKDKRSQLALKELTTDFFYSRQHIILDKLYARINNSIVKNYVALHYKTPADFDDFNALVKINARFDACQIDAQDLARFAPELYAYQENYRLKGKFAGTVNDFEVDEFRLDFGQKSYFDGKIAFKGLPEIEKAVMNFSLKPSFITAEDARQYAGETYYEKHVKQFGNVQFQGTFAGLSTNFTTDLVIESSGLGKAKGKVSVQLSDDPTLSVYKGDVDIVELELGKLVAQDEVIQQISFHGKMEGKGMTIKSAKLNLDGFIEKIDFNGYTFKNITVLGEMGQSIFEGTIQIDDPNLVADVGGKVDFNPALNHFLIHGMIENANLFELGYAKEKVELHSKIDLDFEGNELDNWLGKAQFSDAYMGYGSRYLVADSVFLYSTNFDNQRKISLVSDFFTIDVQGNYVPSQVISDATRLAKEYGLYFVGDEQKRTDYYLQKSTNQLFNASYEADYKIKFKKSEPFFTYFYPSVFVSPETNLQGKLTMRNTAEFSMEGESDSLKIGNYAFINNTLDFTSSKFSASPDVLSSFIFSSEKQQLNNVISTEKLNFSGVWGEPNLILFDGGIRQATTDNYAQLFGSLSILPEGFAIRFNHSNTFLNLLNEQWRLASENLIYVNGEEIEFQNIALGNQRQQVKLEGNFSRNTEKEAILSIDDFALKTVEPITKVDINGLLNGTVVIKNFYDKMFLISHLSVKDFFYKTKLFGDIRADADWDSEAKKLRIEANVNQLKKDIFSLAGTYDPTQERNSLQLTAELDKVNLSLFEGFVEEAFSDLGGFAEGKLTIKGKPTEPKINGKIIFSEGRLRINTLNSYLYFDDDILLNEEGFVTKPEGFVVRDEAQNGHPAVLKGGVYIGGNNRFMLDIKATIPDRENFLLMNTTLKDNDYFFGKAYASGQVTIGGNFNNVLITGNLTSKRNTKLTIPLDGSTTINTEQEAIPFMDKNKLLVSQQFENKVESVAVPKINLNGLRMLFNVTMTPDAECEIIFDRTNNDQLNARGSGRLTIEYDTRGGFTMTGPYEVQSGKYNFSLQNIASLRKFNIKEGSRIEWSGDPYDAKLKMQALYTTNVSLADIPGVQTTLQATESSTRYPVNVVVNLTDKLMHPTVSFDMNFDEEKLPANYRTQVLAFQQRLRNDEQLLSRNVSSVLAVNQLFPNDIVAAIGQQFLIDNISNILSNQIGNIANQIDPNLELGVQFGDFTKNLTNTQVNVSYKYNRLFFKGNSFYSTGNSLLTETQQQGQLSVGGELEYLLNDDGSWRMRVYSRSVPFSSYSFSTSTTGNVLIYGISFQFARNFNSLFPAKKTFPKGISVPTTPQVVVSKEVSMK
jgi:TamB, inner membrane protein subunit of TAM complex